ncbi:MAG: hypothetical protein ABI591_04480 [Kofleriaceae bacterium]
MEPTDARAWLDRGETIGGDSFHARHEPRAFVDALFAAGATAVSVEARQRLLVVGLPADATARVRLFAIYNLEVDELGEEFGGEETPGHEMTAEEADLLGAEVGEWIVDDLHAVDSGQTALHFWWD